MKTHINFRSYLAQTFLGWEIFEINVVEKIKTRILCSKCFSENRAVYDIMWRNIVEPVGHRWQYGACAFSRRIHKATNTHSEYVMFSAFPRQQWLHERASVLRHTTLPVLLYITYTTEFYLGGPGCRIIRRNPPIIYSGWPRVYCTT
jgi:hypothetical protein